ncbi:MAG: tetratricopeptide repeat protein [Flavobacteriales bacterium]|nr:tetratricopeptide repeat protein [Flavobacteriales bacterium]MCB9204720.1 tetratricopeptide repeat protein [Flavobacteriales bacterium]
MTSLQSSVMKRVLSVLLVVAASGQLLAQRVASDVDPLREYSVGLELYQKQKFAASQERFDVALAHVRDLPSIQQENAKYYQASSALQLFNKDGETLMQGFIKSHPEHPMVNQGNFELAKYYFTKKRYHSVLEQLALVDPQDLDKKFLEEYYFKKGYSHFQQEEYDESKAALSKVLADGKKYRSPALYYSSYILYREGQNEAALAGFKELEDDKLFGKVAPFYVLQIHYRQGRNEEVLDYGAKLLEKDYSESKSGEIHRMMGEAYFNLGRYAEAIPEMEIAISELGGNRDDRYKLAYASYRGGDFQKAITYFQQITGEEDEMTQLAFYHMGDCYLKLDQKMEARSAFRSASKYAFDEQIKEDALFNFAKTAYELSYDPYNEAVSAFEEYIAKNPNSERVDEAYEFLLQVYLTTKNYEAAIDAIDKIKQKTEGQKATYQRICYTRATELFHDLRFKRAVHYLKRSDKFPIDPKITSQAIFWQAEAYARMRKWKAAEEHYKLFLDAPAAIGSREFGLAHYGLAYVQFENDQYEPAINWFRKFVDYEKQDSLRVNDGLLRIADSYYLQKENKLAIQYYDKAIKYNKFDTDYAIFQIAVCYGLDGQNASKIETMKAMLDNYPETDFAADAKYEIAETYFFTDNPQLAIVFFDKVIKEHPNSHYVRKAKLNKGLLFYNQSEDEAAMPLFEDVAENYPATEEAKEALMKIQKVYIERGDVPGFEAYVAEKNFPDITTGALDTSYYEAAEFMFTRGNLEGAMAEFKTYLDKFPHGFFALNAHFYRSEAALELKLYNEAIVGYDHILEFKKNAFTERSLMAASSIYFFQEKYQDALLRFTMLEEVAEEAENLMKAREGLMRCNYLLNNFEEAHKYAMKLKRSDKVPERTLQEASLISAKCAMAQGNLRMAEERFKMTLLEANNEIGAEALYNLANIHYLNDSLEKAQSLIFEMVNLFPNYAEWITRSFLLLADAYVKQGEEFQAKLTLQNLIDNYDGELQAEAKQKLAELEAAEPELEERKDGEDWEVQFEQEGKVRDDIFEVDEDEEYEEYEPNLEEE